LISLENLPQECCWTAWASCRTLSLLEKHALIHIKGDGLLNEWQGPAGWELRVGGGTLPAGRLRSPPAPRAPHASTITAVSRLTTGSTSSRTGKAIA